MNKHRVLTISLLFFGSTVQSMFKHKKAVGNNAELDKKTIHSLDDVKKLREDQLQYRNKHKVFKDESNDVRLGVDEKK
jgi:hypothetical protein